MVKVFLSNSIKKETHYDNMYLKHGEIIILEGIKITQDLERQIKDHELYSTEVLTYLTQVIDEVQAKNFPLVYPKVSYRNSHWEAKWLRGV